MPLKCHRILVTGGAGFIGSHLVDELIREGHKVSVLDNFSTGKTENMRQNLHNTSLQLINGDVCKKPMVKQAIADSEIVFHLAAITSVPYSVRHPDVTRDVNVAGTMNLLRASLSNAVKQFIFVSTCAIYGEAKYLPIDEQHPTNPASPYAMSKLEAERYCRKFQTIHGLKVTILRLFNVYGPRMRKDQYGGVITKFVQQLSSGKRPIIYGDGTQTRDFIHVQDVVSAIKKTVGNDKASGQTFNIATGIPTTINHLAQQLSELTGTEGLNPRYCDARPGDLNHSYASIQKAKNYLEYEPRILLREGLSNLIGRKNATRVKSHPIRFG